MLLRRICDPDIYIGYFANDTLMDIFQGKSIPIDANFFIAVRTFENIFNILVILFRPHYVYKKLL